MKRLSFLFFLIVSIASCATIPSESVNRGKLVSTSDKKNCFGLDVPIRFYASETFGAGYFGGSINVSTLFGFGFTDETKRKIAYANISLDPVVPAVGVRFLDAQGQDVVRPITRYKTPRIIDCGENRTEISFTDSLGGDGGRENRLITLIFTQDKEFARIDSRRESTYCTLFFCGSGETKEFSGNFRLLGGKLNQ